MADLSKDEMQSLVNEGAPRLWALEDLISAGGDPVLVALVSDLHARAAALIVGAGLTLPARVALRSGGGGKG
jgi:hypothetical protein